MYEFIHVNGGNFGHGVVPGHNSLFRNKRKIRIYFTRVFFAAHNFEAGVTPHVRSYVRVRSYPHLPYSYKIQTPGQHQPRRGKCCPVSVLAIANYLVDIS